MFRTLIVRLKKLRLTMRMKISFSILSIAVILLTSSVISIMEYSRMSSYVSELIAGNINNINLSQKLANISNEYNLKILTVIDDNSSGKLPDFNQSEFLRHCEDLRGEINTTNMAHLADSVEYAYSAYMLTSLELEDVTLSDFIDTRAWYFDRLQPAFNRLRAYEDALHTAMYNDLRKNSATFERGFYRSIIPGAVAVAVGILLVLMLLFFILSYYVNPIYRMLAALENYRSVGKAYDCHFDGDDQLSMLNDGIADVAEENSHLRKSLKAMRESKPL